MAFSRRLELLRGGAWSSREAAATFFERWSIEDEPGEVAIELLGDVGLVPLR